MSAAHSPSERSERNAEGDTILVESIRLGDERALGSLYDGWVDRVYSIAAHLLGNPADAENVVERTFLQISKNAAHYDPTRGSVAAWIVVIARSHALSLRRGQDRRQRADRSRTDHLANDRSIAAASPLHEIESRDR